MKREQPAVLAFVCLTMAALALGAMLWINGFHWLYARERRAECAKAFAYEGRTKANGYSAVMPFCVGYLPGGDK